MTRRRTAVLAFLTGFVACLVVITWPIPAAFVAGAVLLTADLWWP